MMCPSDMRMPSIFVAILLSTHGLFDLKKCPDVPESASARFSTCLCVIVFVVSMMFICLSTNLSHTNMQTILQQRSPEYQDIFYNQTVHVWTKESQQIRQASACKTDASYIPPTLLYFIRTLSPPKHDMHTFSLTSKTRHSSQLPYSVTMDSSQFLIIKRYTSSTKKLPNTSCTERATI